MHISETTFHVRYAETDQMGIVHHAAYLVWLEEGRSQWLRDHGTSFVEFEKDGVTLAVSEVNARYSKAARYDQLITVRCWIKEVKSRRLIFGYQIVDPQDGSLFFSGTTKHICVDHQGKVTKIPDKWRTLMG